MNCSYHVPNYDTYIDMGPCKAHPSPYTSLNYMDFYFCCLDFTLVCWYSRANLHGWPNTYVFTKAMGEILLMKMKDTLPLFVIRPTTVVSTHSEPFPGWIEGVRCIIYHILYIYIYIINKRIIWVSWKI